MIDELSDKPSPHDPFNPERSLSGHLQSVYRIRKARFGTRRSGFSDLGIIDFLHSISASR